MPSYRSLPPGSHGMEPVVLRGTFAVRDGALAAHANAEGELLEWGDLGWPGYSGAMTYHTRFSVPEGLDGRRLLLVCADVRETMEVAVNGQAAGLRLWPPYRLDITAFANPGDNNLAITVTNTLSNLLTRTLPSGLLGPVHILVMLIQR